MYDDSPPSSRENICKDLIGASAEESRVRFRQSARNAVTSIFRRYMYFVMIDSYTSRGPLPVHAEWIKHRPMGPRGRVGLIDTLHSAKWAPQTRNNVLLRRNLAKKRYRYWPTGARWPRCFAWPSQWWEVSIFSWIWEFMRYEWRIRINFLVYCFMALEEGSE